MGLEQVYLEALRQLYLTMLYVVGVSVGILVILTILASKQGEK